MAERRRGLGRGLGALIPPAEPGAPRPIDVFFTDQDAGEGGRTATARDGSPYRSGSDDDRATGVIDVRESAEGLAGNAGSRASDAEDAAPSRAARRREGERTPSRGATGGWPDQELVPVPGLEFLEVPVDHVAPNPRQPRRVFDEDALAELADSVREIGVLQPVVVRRVEGSGAEGADGPRYELVMGERRWRATRLAGLATVPAIVRRTRDDALLRDALLENLHRSDLNALEEAAAYQQLLDDFGCTHDQLAQRIGRSRPQISNTIRLLRLPPSVQLRLAAGVLTAGHARAILGLPDGGAMERLAQRVVAEGLSVRATEELVSIGVDAEPVARPRSAGVRLPGLDDLAGRLSDRLDTRVSVSMGQRKGRLVVEFAGADDLNRLLTALAPGDPGLGTP